MPSPVHYLEKGRGAWEVLGPDFDTKRDLGFLTTFLARPGHATPFVQLHFERLKQGAAIFSLDLPWQTCTEFAAQIDGFVCSFLTRPNIIRVACVPETQKKSITVIWTIRDYHPKTHALSLNVLQYDQAEPYNNKTLARLAVDQTHLLQVNAQGYDDFIRLNHRHTVTESSYANVFWVCQNQLYTPHVLTTGCVPGVMRQVVLQAAHQEQISYHEGDYTLEDVCNADVVFLTNAVHGIHEVGRIAEQQYRSANENPLVQALLESIAQQKPA